MKVNQLFIKAKYSKKDKVVYGINKNKKLIPILSVRAWEEIQTLFMISDTKYNYDKAVKYQDKLGKFIADAINEKISTELKNK